MKGAIGKGQVKRSIEETHVSSFVAALVVGALSIFALFVHEIFEPTEAGAFPFVLGFFCIYWTFVAALYLLLAIAPPMRRLDLAGCLLNVAVGMVLCSALPIIIMQGEGEPSILGLALGLFQGAGLGATFRWHINSKRLGATTQQGR